MTTSRVLIVGAGMFGAVTALELRRRGYDVTLLEAGAAPNAVASSNDNSRVVRMDYGDDEFYTNLAAEAIEAWRVWNRGWTRPYFHEDGVLFLTAGESEEADFEQQSRRQLAARGIELTSFKDAARNYPAWMGSEFDSGYFNRVAGWVEAGEVLGWLIRRCVEEGVAVRSELGPLALDVSGDGVLGVRYGDQSLKAERVVVSAGAWTARVVPESSTLLRATAQPVFYFRPEDPDRFAHPNFAVWTADITRTGFYGFPLDRFGLVKVGHHGCGRVFDTGGLGSEVRPSPDEANACRAFLARALPELAQAELARSRYCLYCDSSDGDFLIAPHPTVRGLTVAAGGSGHGFKFAPVLGPIIADVVESKPNAYAERFAWRASTGKEGSRSSSFLGE